MGVQQIAPWVSLVAGVLSFAYIGFQEWRRTVHREGEDTSEANANRRSIGEVVASAAPFLVVVVSLLFFAALSHYVLVLVSLSSLAVPVWLLTGMVVVLFALIQSMPGETFDEKVDQFTEKAGATAEVDVDVDVDQSVEDATETTGVESEE